MVSKDGWTAILLVVLLAGCGGNEKPVANPQRAATPSAVQPDSAGSSSSSSTKNSSQADAPASSQQANSAAAKKKSAASGDGGGRPFNSAGSGADKKKEKKERAKPSPPAVTPVFANVAAALGVNHTFYSDSVPDRYFLPEIMGGGAAWIDFDGDGWLDLFLANGARLKDPDPAQTEHQGRLFRNVQGERFIEVSVASGAVHNGYGQGLAVGDYDADGFPDLYYSCYGADVLFHNNGDGTFENVTATARVSDTDWSSSCAWFDADLDGDLDLYVVNYMDVTMANYRICYYQEQPGYCGPGEYKGVPDRLYINQGDGTFTDQLDAFGMTADEGKGLAISIVDFDHDLRPEIYVANDMTANFLFTRGDAPLVERAKRRGGESAIGAARRYAEVGLMAGCAVSSTGMNEASMGISCADFDNDSLPDIYLTHFFNSKNTLYHNLGDLGFVDDSFRTRAAATSYQSLGFGTVPLDYDLDGSPDLFVANGHVLGPKVRPYEMTPQLLRNDGRGRLDDISELAGSYFTDLWVGRSAAGGDFDNDGDQDVAVTHLHRPVALLQNNTRTGRHFVGIELRTKNRVPPVGGRVRVTNEGVSQVLPVQAGGSYLGASDARLLFGVRNADGGAQVEIHWPSGAVQRLDGLAVDRYWIIYEGESPVVVAGRGAETKP